MRALAPTLLLVLLALGVRLVAGGIRGLDREPVKDERNYRAIAASLREGRGFSMSVTRTVDGAPVTRTFTALRPPVYPATLAAVESVFGTGVAVGRLLSAVLGALAVGAFHLWARRLLAPAGGGGAGFAPALAAVLLAVWPAHVFVSGELLSEPLYLLLLLGFAAALQAGRALPAGILLGLAVLTRPAALLLLPAAALVLARPPRPGRRRTLLLLALPALLLPVPWALRNAALHGRPLLATNLGVTFLGGNSDLSLEAEVPGRWHVPEKILTDDPPDLGYYGWSGLTEAESDRRFLRAGLAWVRDHPGRFARLLLHKAARFFDPDPRSRKADRGLKRWAGWLSFGPVLPLGILGLVLLRRRGRRLGVALAILVCHFLVALVFYGDARFRLPAVPVFLVGAAAALEWGWIRLRAARRASPGRPAA